MKKQILGNYVISEERLGRDTVTWVHTKEGKLIRGFWDLCGPTRRGHAVNLVQGLSDGTLKETFKDVYGPAKEWNEWEELPDHRTLFTIS